MSDEPVLDPHAFERLERLGGPALVRRMIELYLELGPARLDTLNAAVAAADARRVEHSAHTLRSTANNVGAVHVEREAHHLENSAGNGAIDAARARRVVAEYDRAAAALRDALKSLQS